MPRVSVLRRRLVAGLQLEDARVRAALLAVPRERFVPAYAAEHGLAAVYRDEPLVTKRDAGGRPISSSSQPQIMATMLERLELAPGQRVLEIGAGTGYNAALISTLVGPTGRVVSIDVDAELATAARRALRAGGHAVRVVTGDGRDGFPPGAPYDRIVATVSTGVVPRAWRDQLAEGGLLELPLQLERGEQVVATFRRDGARLVSVAVVDGGFMPLRGTRPPAQPTLHAGASLPGERPVNLVRLSGPALADISPAALRRLLATAAGRPRRVRLADADRWSLRLYLALELPDARLVESAELGLGVVGRGGRSLALADTTAAGGRTPTRRLLAFGDAEAEQYLRRQIERWRDRGSPGAAQLELSIDVEADGAPVTRRWARTTTHPK